MDVVHRDHRGGRHRDGLRRHHQEDHLHQAPDVDRQRQGGVFRHQNAAGCNHQCGRRQGLGERYLLHRDDQEEAELAYRIASAVDQEEAELAYPNSTLDPVGPRVGPSLGQRRSADEAGPRSSVRPPAQLASPALE